MVVPRAHGQLNGTEPRARFQAEKPTATSDRVCASATLCTVNQFELQPKTATTNRLCKTLTTCVPGEFIDRPNAVDRDRVCRDCDGVTGYSKVDNARSCIAKSFCDLGA